MVTQFENLLSSSQVARILGTSSNEVIRLANSGALPHLRIGVGSKKRYKFRPSALQAYIAECEQSPAKPEEEPTQRRRASKDAGDFSALRSFGYQG